MKDKNKISAFKITGLDGKWGIVLAEDEFIASEHFQSENNISEDDITLIEPLNLSDRIHNVYTVKKAYIAEMIEWISFFPRCVLESEDL